MKIMPNIVTEEQITLQENKKQGIDLSDSNSQILGLFIFPKRIKE